MVGRLRLNAVMVMAVLGLVASCAGSSGTLVAGQSEAVVGEADVGDSGGPTTTAAETTTTVPLPPANTLTLERLRRITGDITPKSVVASGKGAVTAQNMMYTHTVTAYDDEGNLVATVPDTVRLSDFGFDDEGEFQGAPVEASFTPDGKDVYVSNYSMYGPGYGEGSDSCSPGDGTAPSYLYRIGTGDWSINQVIPTGAVPKYVQVTPDGSRVLVTNWCTWTLTVADTDSGEVLDSIEIGRYPRGIAVTSDSSTAYIAVMGTTDVAVVDLATSAVSWINGVGGGPRHVVLGPDDEFLYVTLNKEGVVAKVDTASGTVVEKVETGNQPRSMDISRDGTALYVVNYESDNMAKLDTSDMSVLQTVPTGHHPIGITYDDGTGRVWVASYAGSIDVYDEVAPA